CLSAGVMPGGAVVRANEAVKRPDLRATGVLYQAGEDTFELLSILEILADNGGSVGVVHQVVPEKGLVVPTLAVQHIVDQPAQEGDVSSSPNGRVDIGHGTGAGEPGVDVDELGPLGFGLHRP